MKMFTSLLLAITFLVNSTAFATSTTSQQEMVKKSMDAFVKKVEKTKHASDKRKVIAELMDNAANAASESMNRSDITQEEREAVEKFQSLNIEYRDTLDQIADKDLNDFAKAYATEYQKASVIYVLSILLCIGAGAWLFMLLTSMLPVVY